MEYIFGQVKRKGRIIDVLKTVGETHTDLKDNHIIERKYSDSIITDGFYVVDHYLSKDGADGKCYDWYELANHYRYIDYFTPQKAQIEGDIKDTQDALLEVDEDRLQAQADAEDALIELDEAINTRLDDIENAICELSEEEV